MGRKERLKSCPTAVALRQRADEHFDKPLHMLFSEIIVKRVTGGLQVQVSTDISTYIKIEFKNQLFIMG